MESNIVKIEINFFSEWHMGSALATGSHLDAIVVKDDYGLPYVPGKTLKGLLRDAAYDLLQYNASSVSLSRILRCFGQESHSDEDGAMGLLHFSNVDLIDKDFFQHNHHLVDYLFLERANISIGEDGISTNGSLRKIETVIPVVLEGEIRNVPLEEFEFIEILCRYTRFIGSGRNRGMGRCSIKLKKS